MKILVTGSSGRVGRNIYIHLMRYHQVVGLDVSPCSTVDFVGDIRDPALIQSALKGVDVIVHTASLHAPHVGLRSDEEFIDINVRATEQLVNMGIEYGITHFVYTSTTALYGYASTPEGRSGWITEEVTPQPKTIYHKSKIQAETLLQRLSKENSLPVTVLQMSRCFPEPADIMAIYRLNRGVDARDVASAHACAINMRPNGFTRYIISAKTPFGAGDCESLFQCANEAIKKRVPELVDEFNLRGWKLPDKLDRVYDSSLAQEELNWEPVHGYEGVLELLDNGIAEVLPV
ncbi:TPA: NAD(P)-dependent oxidoreductase [Vibrio parahaemolyticus]|uniref:NAD-dependent epimerase/dehydratase family protein n=1 Tax=Vibrio parahaemolyticus TaxID=670 RepID=UPI00111E8511|nr:NAD(P)-dependent oxidoreductase [Vibrio parahaemolyticus]MDF4940783.1 NAD(P)-dependent oxidoreductase [Vibrio parahaemolyticus]TOK38010.1 epimerase [Vibrio parahaemolyticus]HCE3704369.1 NAD(P)-dependent oxidoreductase [Vibrio parahaemolyticus]HCE3706174.1 NAD(P)-dependent oxidoreductase [Vibrio parahaemolyticus]